MNAKRHPLRYHDSVSLPVFARPPMTCDFWLKYSHGKISLIIVIKYHLTWIVPLDCHNTDCCLCQQQGYCGGSIRFRPLQKILPQNMFLVLPGEIHSSFRDYSCTTYSANVSDLCGNTSKVRLGCIIYRRRWIGASKIWRLFSGVSGGSACCGTRPRMQLTLLGVLTTY